MDEAVRARGVTRTFGEIVALDGVDLAVRAGLVHGMVGPNGSGKTTLLSMLFGLVRPDQGAVHVLGRPVSTRGRVQGLAGFVDAPHFYPYLTARQNLELLARLDGDRTIGRVREALEVAGLVDAAAERVRGFSAGMRQRLGLAASLLSGPQVLVLDEPANGLDPAAMRDLRGVLADLAASGVTVLLSSHNMAEIEQLCHAVTVLSAGRVAFDGPLDTMRRMAPPGAYRMDTADDETATRLAGPGMSADIRPPGGMRVLARPEQLDRFVVRLGQAGIAIRRLTPESTPLESFFLALTEAA